MQEEDVPSNSKLSEKKASDNGFNREYWTFLLTSPQVVRGSLYRPPKHWVKTLYNQIFLQQWWIYLESVENSTGLSQVA